MPKRGSIHRHFRRNKKTQKTQKKPKHVPKTESFSILEIFFVCYIFLSNANFLRRQKSQMHREGVIMPCAPHCPKAAQQKLLLPLSKKLGARAAKKRKDKIMK